MDRSKSLRNGQQFQAHNASLMGPLAYHVVYSSPQETTDAEFVGYKDKWHKKAPSVWASKPFITVIFLESYLRAARLVAEHYLSAVGRFYNMCVVLTNYTYVQKHKGKDTEVLEQALAIVWRLLYEGLGLAGWTPPARLFLNILITSSFGLKSDPKDPKFTVVRDGDWEDEGYPAWWQKGLKPSIVTQDTPVSARISAIPYLAELMGITHLPKHKVIVRYLIWACKVSLDWGAIEAGKPRVEMMKESEFHVAVVMGALRRCAQGKDYAGMEELAYALDIAQSDGGGEDAETGPQSCVRLVINDETGKLEPWARAVLGDHPVLCETLELAASTHLRIEDYLFAQTFVEEI